MKRKVPAVTARGILARVPLNVSFWLCTNENLRSLPELFASLQKADDEVFRYHVNRDKNDFEVWIRDVLKDKDLAREIARVKTRDTLIRKISERVEELQSVVKKSRSSRQGKRSSRIHRIKRRRIRRIKSRQKSKVKGGRSRKLMQHRPHRRYQQRRHHSRQRHRRRLRR